MAAKEHWWHQQPCSCHSELAPNFRPDWKCGGAGGETACGLEASNGDLTSMCIRMREVVTVASAHVVTVSRRLDCADEKGYIVELALRTRKT